MNAVNAEAQVFLRTPVIVSGIWKMNVAHVVEIIVPVQIVPVFLMEIILKIIVGLVMMIP
jgi:hypothetical protein